MAYVYAGVWFLIGLLLIFRFRKENKIFLFLGLFFLLLGGWWTADAMLGGGLFTGVWGIVFRVIVAACLVVACIAYYRETKKRGENGPDKEKE